MIPRFRVFVKAGTKALFGVGMKQYEVSIGFYEEEKEL